MSTVRLGMTPKAAMIREMARSLDSFDAKEIFSLDRGDPWGFQTLREMDEEFWDQQEAKAIAARKKKRPWWFRYSPEPNRRGKAPGWLLVGFGFGLGALGLLVWRFFRDRKLRRQQDAAAGRGPLRQEVWVPREPEQQCQLLATARSWIADTPMADDFELARAVWRSHWPDVPYPRPPHERDHPSLGEALQLVDAAIEVARGRVDEVNDEVNADEASIYCEDSPTSDAELARIDAALAAELAGDRLPGSDEGANGESNEVVTEGDWLPGRDEGANGESIEAVIESDQLPGSEGGHSSEISAEGEPLLGLDEQRAAASDSDESARGDQLPGSERGLPSSGNGWPGSDESASAGGNRMVAGDELGPLDPVLAGEPLGFDLSPSSGSSAKAEPIDLAALTRPAPTPGYLYLVDADEILDDVAEAALRRAGLEAGAKRGWAPAKAQARADKLARSERRRAAYRALIERSSWNANHADGPLWLPPLRLGALFDRTRRSKVTLAPGSWPDGTSKLEPPPGLHAHPFPEHERPHGTRGVNP